MLISHVHRSPSQKMLMSWTSTSNDPVWGYVECFRLQNPKPDSTSQMHPGGSMGFKQLVLQLSI